MVTIIETKDLKKVFTEALTEFFNHGGVQNTIHSTNDVIGINEVSKITSLKPSTIRKKIYYGEIPVLEKGKPLLFSRHQIIQWQDSLRRNKRV